MLLGCIGDDFTGSSDLGNTLARAGMRTVQYVGTPNAPASLDVEAGVVALKSRSAPVADAVRLSLAALDWLKAQGCTQFLFKYCSTFDSTRTGNIGPVAEALADALDAHQVLFCPAFPTAGRTVYQGHLFVGDQLLHESGMQNHPLTPMTDADLRRWLAYQTVASVGHLPASAVWQGVDAARAHLSGEQAKGNRLIVADAVRDDDLFVLGKAVDDLALVTGGSGIAMGLPANFRAKGLLAGTSNAWRAQAGPAAVLCGSCSATTRRQVAHHRACHPAFEITAQDVMAGKTTAQTVADWMLAQDELPLAYSSAKPAAVLRAQQEFGAENIAAKMETLFAQVARLLVAGGVTRLITAGGETSGAVVKALGPDKLQIGPEIDPGVPAMRANEALVLALKSGNFGAEDFFQKAATRMATDA